MKYRTWNVRSLPRSGSLTTVAKELTRYKLNLVCVQEVRWDKGSTSTAGDYNLFYRKKRKSSTRDRNFLHYRIASAVKRAEFFDGRMPYIILRGRWCNIIALNVHARSE